MSKEIFKVGESVIWRESFLCEPHHLKEILDFRGRYGAGPFKVDQVCEVPDTCNCGASMIDKDGFQHFCPYNRPYGKPIRESVGHTQWLYVTGADRTGPIENHKFSGAWFTHA